MKPGARRLFDRLRGTNAQPAEPPVWLASSPWFDAEWYARTYPDVVAAGIEPLQHYWANGAGEGRSPGPRFDAAAYEAMNPAARGRALEHYTELSAGRADAPDPTEVVDPDHVELASGLFDADWYVRHVPAAADETHPYVHYCKASKHRPLNPGPLFDNEEYLARVPAARQATSALAHFVQHRADGATARVVAEPTDRGPLAQPSIGQSPARDVCVIIHSFYVDLLAELLQPLTTLAGSATILISVCDEADVAEADAIVTRVLGAGTTRVVRCVPNRGRNFAPLLCSFADEVRRHELLVHLHTKKSLYSGGERLDWRQHLLRALTGPAVPAILDLFATDPTVGVLQPSIFPEMPSWAAHWLVNAEHGRELFARCGLDPADVEGYVDYPVGGMFWARVAALRPLLDAGLTVDDFEPEAGQTDGTLAHAVERTITSVAGGQGFRFVEFDYEAAQWRVGWASRNTGAFGDFDRGLLRRQFAIVDLVSVDVFDTIVLRPALDPTALQYFAARTLTDDPAAADEMVRQRIAAEHQARVHHPDEGDVTLDEIYAELPTELHPLQDAEVAIEPRVAVPRAWLIDELKAAKAAGKRLVAMTDTTLTRATIQQLLDLVGAGDLFDELYVSNECRARKDTGGMWRLVAEREGVPVERWLHIGDNEASDIQQALTHRVGWSHVPAPRAVAQFHAPTAHNEHTNWATGAALGLSACALYPGVPITDHDDAFGYAVLGPLVASFIGRLIEQGRRHPEQRMLLLARDTQLFFDTMFDLRQHLGRLVPPIDYFPVSRRAALGVSLAEGLDASLILDGGAFDGVFADMVEARTGYRPAGEQYQVQVSHPAERERCTALLQSLADELQAHGRLELAGFRRYLASIGLDGTTPLCLVDLGYAATTQRALARVLPNTMDGVYCATTPAAAAAVGEGQAVSGHFADGVPFWSGNWFIDNSLLLEALLSSSDGPTISYQATDPNLGFVFGAAPRVDPRVTRVKAAATRFCTDLAAMYGPAVYADGLDPAAVLHWVSRVPSRFLPPPQQLFAGLRIENGFIGVNDDEAVT